MARRKLVGPAIAAISAVLCPIACCGTVAINEVAWAGNALDYAAEWIELVNTGPDPVDLEGWRLVSSDGAPNILLSGVLHPVGPGPTNPGYYLLERDSERSVPSRSADLIYSGALGDRGESLTLFDAEGVAVDVANVRADGARNWYGGTAWTTGSVPRSMERVNPLLPDAPDNWASALCRPEDQSAGLYCGTPGAENSAFNVPPIARMEISPQYPTPGETVRFDAGASQDLSGRIVSFSWAFGDGTTQAGQTASHVYATPGEYDVTLTVRDDRGATALLSARLSVRFASPPRADFSVIAAYGGVPRAGTAIAFVDESGDGSSPIVERLWSFGDGATATEERAFHTFESAGTFNVCLSVTDGRGTRSERCEALTVASRIPIAEFEIEPGLHSEGDLVGFDGSASFDLDGEIARYVWDFDGDGTPELSSAEPKAEYAFPSGGFFAPCLVVEDDRADRSEPICRGLYVNAAPSVEFAISNFTPDEAEPVSFTDLSCDPDGTIIRWRWEFGDGEEALQTAPTHAYRRSGAYTVSLTATDDQSASRTASATIDVANLAPLAALAVVPAVQPTGTPFTFDASSSVDPSPEGRIVTYEWDLNGDGVFERKTSSPTESASYDDDGIVLVTVRVTDDEGATAVSSPCEIHAQNRPPVAEEIAWNVTAPKDGEEIRFTASASDPDGVVTGWMWSFDGEGTSSDEEPEHVFRQSRTYAVTVTVRDDDGASSLPLKTTMCVDNAAPVAAFSLAGTSGDTARFDAGASFDPSPEGEIVHFAWDFGDGSARPDDPNTWGTGSQRSPEHTFPGPGTYDVTLVVIDDDGGIGRSTRSVTIP
jgi:PKD repeat protein